MAKKNKKKIILIAGIAVIAVIIMIVFGFQFYKDKKAYEDYINNGNKFTYLNFKCISDCPVKIVIGENSTFIRFADNCVVKCETDAVQAVSQSDKIEIKEKDYGKLLVQDIQFVACKNSYDIEGNADKFKFCLNQILPGLKEKYNIN
jgi:hypothetical protein